MPRVTAAAVVVISLLACGCTAGRHRGSTIASSLQSSAPGPAEATPARPLLEPGDLEILVRAAGEAELVGLGENVHGTHELHELGFQIFRELNAAHQFRTYAYEIDFAHALLLDDYVAGRRYDLDALLTERWWASEQFYDQALREGLVWMRRHNERTTEKVRFAGYDLKQPALAAAILVRELAERDRGAAAQVQLEFETIAQLGSYGTFPNVRGWSASLTLRVLAGEVLHLRLAARQRGMEFGSAGMALRVADQPLAVTTIDGHQSPEDGWRPLSLEVAIPDGVAAVDLTVYHRGNGTVWFVDAEAKQGPTTTPIDLASADRSPLMMPSLQTMDYGAEIEPPEAVGGRPSLRVACDPRVDRALGAAERITQIVRRVVATPEVPADQASRWLRLATAIEQAVAWRTLKQNNRDVFLAENLRRLVEDIPGVLALGHTSHTEALPQRMGDFLRHALGDRYRMVSLLALGGSAHTFGPPTNSTVSKELVVAEFAPRLPFERVIEALAAHQFVFDLRADEALRAHVATSVDLSAAPDLVAVVRSATPSRLLDDAGLPPHSARLTTSKSAPARAIPK